MSVTIISMEAASVPGGVGAPLFFGRDDDDDDSDGDFQEKENTTKRLKARV